MILDHSNGSKPVTALKEKKKHLRKKATVWGRNNRVIVLLKIMHVLKRTEMML